MSNLSETIYVNSISNTTLLWGTNQLSVDIPSDVQMVVLDMWANGGTISADHYLLIRANGSSSSLFNRAGRYHNGTSYVGYNTTTTSWYSMRQFAAGNSGFARHVFYPRGGSTNYKSSWSYMTYPGAAYHTVYNRFQSGADISSLQVFTSDGTSTSSFDILVRAYR